MKMWDRAFVINLERRRDRWADTQDELRRCGIAGVERWDGFDHPTSGHEGCTRSHRELMRHVASGPWDRVLVFEDDLAAVTKNRLRISGFKESQTVWQRHCSILDGEGSAIERIIALSAFWPEKWDMIYLGGGYGEAPISRLNAHMVRCGTMKGTGSYIVTKSFAKAFTEAAELESCGDLKHFVGPIDNYFGKFSKDYLHYCIQPRVFFQRKSPSDISGESNSHLYLGTDPTHESMV